MKSARQLIALLLAWAMTTFLPACSTPRDNSFPEGDPNELLSSSAEGLDDPSGNPGGQNLLEEKIWTTPRRGD